MFKRLLFFVTLSCYAVNTAYAEVLIIVNPANEQAISETDIRNLFSGKQKSFPDGSSAIVLALPEGTKELSHFNSKVLGKSDAQMKAYWSKMMFTGKGTPPKEVVAEEMLKLVATNPSTIGFVDASIATSDVRIVGKF